MVGVERPENLEDCTAVDDGCGWIVVEYIPEAGNLWD